MVNREKFIVMVMIIVAAYGGYAYFFDSDDTSIVEGSKQTIAELKKFVIDAATSLSNDYISAADKYIIDQAEKAWPQDPFLQPGALLTAEPFEARAEVTVQTFHISYTGFLQMSDSLIAIINGAEYEVGDQMSETGYYVTKILPTKVILGIENNPDTIILPLDEPVNMSLEEKE